MALREFAQTGFTFLVLETLNSLLRAEYPETPEVKASELLSDLPSLTPESLERKAILYPKMPRRGFYGGFVEEMNDWLVGTHDVSLRGHRDSPGLQYLRVTERWSWDKNCAFILPETFPAVVRARGAQGTCIFVAEDVCEVSGRITCVGPSGARYNTLDARHFLAVRDSLPAWYTGKGVQTSVLSRSLPVQPSLF